VVDVLVDHDRDGLLQVVVVIYRTRRIGRPDGVTGGVQTSADRQVTLCIYTLAWSVISDDGDTINGTIPFTRTAAATPTTTAAAPTAEGHRV
jgi:hypothetical protein